MFLLDTNVVSELRRKGTSKANPSVLRWEESIPAHTLYLSAIGLFELELGVLQILRRDPRQGAMLRRWIDESVLPSFADRILPIDAPVAQRAAAFHVPDPRGERDALVAATALAHRMTIVTRNVADFASTGVPLLNLGSSDEPTS